MVKIAMTMRQHKEKLKIVGDILGFPREKLDDPIELMDPSMFNHFGGMIDPNEFMIKFNNLNAIIGAVGFIYLETIIIDEKLFMICVCTNPCPERHGYALSFDDPQVSIATIQAEIAIEEQNNALNAVESSN